MAAAVPAPAGRALLPTTQHDVERLWPACHGGRQARGRRARSQDSPDAVGDGPCRGGATRHPIDRAGHQRVVIEEPQGRAVARPGRGRTGSDSYCEPRWGRTAGAPVRARSPRRPRWLTSTQAGASGEMPPGRSRRRRWTRATGSAVPGRVTTMSRPSSGSCTTSRDARPAVTRGGSASSFICVPRARLIRQYSSARRRMSTRAGSRRRPREQSACARAARDRRRGGHPA